MAQTRHTGQHNYTNTVGEFLEHADSGPVPKPTHACATTCNERRDAQPADSGASSYEGSHRLFAQQRGSRLADRREPL